MFNESNKYFENSTPSSKEARQEEGVISDKDSKQDIGQQKKYKFFYDNNHSVSNTDIVNVENAVKDHEDVPQEVKDRDLKGKEYLEGISNAKDRIVVFGKKLGFDFQERLVIDDKIYLLNENDFRRFYGNETIEECGGICKITEIIMKKREDCDGNEEMNREIHNVQHELIHSVSKIHYYIKKDNNIDKIAVNNIRSGYHRTKLNKSEAMHLFNEGLTEITNQQLYFENEMFAPETSYLRCVIFLTEMIKDMTKKTGEPEQKILADFQRGMFEGSNKYLKPIIDIYGTEAFCKLRDVRDDDGSFLELAKAFKLRSASKKINDLAKGEKDVKISILNYGYKIIGNNK